MGTSRMLLIASLHVACNRAQQPAALQPTQATGASIAPGWARDLSLRIGTPVTVLLSEWQDDRAHYAVNKTSRVIRDASRGISSVAALPHPFVGASEGDRTNFTIGVLQMQAVRGDINSSMAKADALLAAGEQGKLDLLVFPELAMTGYIFDTPAEAATVAQHTKGTIFQWASRVAKNRSSNVLVGMVEIGTDDNHTLYNSALLVSPSGELLATVRKTALTDVDAQWAHGGTGSKSMPVIDLPPIGRIGIGICKDMSAVDMSSQPGEHTMDESFRSALVDVIVVLAAWDSHDPRETIHNKWKARVSKHLGTDTLLVVADQSGHELGVPFAGSSAIMDLKGPSTLAQLTEEEEGLIIQRFVNHPSKLASSSAAAVVSLAA